MNTITLPAHFDGQQIRLDVPFVLQPHTRLIVTVLPQNFSEPERTAWQLLSSTGLNNAYADDEPDYPLNLIKEENPDYEGR